MNTNVLPTRADAFNHLLKKVLAAPTLLQIHSELEKSPAETVDFVRAAGSLPSFVAASIPKLKQKHVLYVAADMRAAERARDDLRMLLGYDRVTLLPPQHAIPYDLLKQAQRTDERAEVFERLIDRKFDVLIVTPASLVERQVPLRKHRHQLITFTVGDEIDREALALIFTNAGMKREVRAEEPGSFALRGSVIDLYPLSAENPIRLELWGDEITEMRVYDPQTQRSLGKMDETTFYAGEASVESETRHAGIWDMMPLKTVTFIDDRDALEKGLERQWEEIDYQYEKRRDLEKDRKTPTQDELYHRADALLSAIMMDRPCIIHRGTGASTDNAINFESRSHESFLGDVKQLAVNLSANRSAHLESFILFDRDSQVDRMADLLEDFGGASATARMGVAPLHGGFTWPDAGVVVLTDHEIFGRHKRTSPFRRRLRSVDASAFDEFSKGELVVHTEFGVGIYLGPKTIKVGGRERECIQLEYRNGVKVYVRLDQFGLLQKYQGTEGVEPKLSKIGGSDWAKARSKAKKAVEDLAKEILEIYAKRQIEGGFPFSEDTPWQREMEGAFEFTDTPDQTTASEQIKRDMEKPVAMDRLLVGDVGFGKTEVAIRAAFKALQDSKQVAILVPTTILAQQHYQTFIERLRRYPIRIDVLSRFRTKAQQMETTSGLESGEVDLVIGTHRLLSKDIKFKDLGLLIIDEEHRFGVKHKEAIRAMRVSVDVLSMSATPIPRTLHMALSGARDMSMISTPPQDRLPIETEIVPFDGHIIREAILREIARGGQVYFVHNRVQTIYNTKGMLQKLLGDEIKIGVAHGQMKERELEKVMDDFLNEKYQILVTTMIIETGVDIPNVNTMLVNRADRFGLAQLYQLRGRIGRSHRQAYAYLLTPPRLLMQADAKKRLETIAENTRLGSGFQIAMRDLEIRGAGNLLGSQQSGFINTVGFELYTQMLTEAINNLGDKGEVALPDQPATTRHARDVRVDAPVDAMIPTDYMPDATERVEFYRRLSRTERPEEVQRIRIELRDRFGPIPDTASNMLHMVLTQSHGARAGVEKVEIHEEVAYLNFVESWGEGHFDERIAELMAAIYEHNVELRGSGPLGLTLRMENAETWSERWQRLDALMATLPTDA